MRSTSRSKALGVFAAVGSVWGLAACLAHVELGRVEYPPASADGGQDATRLGYPLPFGPAAGGLFASYPNPGVNLEAGPDCIQGVLPASNQAPQAMGGIVGGTTAASTLRLSDAAGITGPLPAIVGGTGMTIGCGTPSATCGPCTDPNVAAYWNSDVNVVLGDSGTQVTTWTDICNGYALSQATNANMPTYTASGFGTRHVLTTTGGAAFALNAVGSGAFPALSIPFSWGILAYATGTPGHTEFFADFGTTAGQNATQVPASGLIGCTGGGTALISNASLQTRPTLVTCSIASQFTAGDSTMGVSSSYAGTEFNNVTSIVTSNPGGGLTLFNSYNGASAVNSPPGWIASFIVWKAGHQATRLEVEAWRSFEQAYTGGI